MRPSTTTTILAACLFAAPVLAAAQQGRGTDRLTDMDRNHDGVVTRQEWTGTAEAFRDRDWNDDDVLSGNELRPGARRGQARRAREAARQDEANRFDDWTVAGFDRLDRNGDGRLSAREWTYQRDTFDEADRNRDGVVTRGEFLNENARAQRRRGPAASTDSRNERRDTRAYDAGWDRGRTEGLQAGREDRERHQGWDLEGQRELESADSGYQPSLGVRADYQAGYRDGFRTAYPEGYGR